MKVTLCVCTLVFFLQINSSTLSLTHRSFTCSIHTQRIARLWLSLLSMILHILFYITIIIYILYFVYFVVCVCVHMSFNLWNFNIEQKKQRQCILEGRYRTSEMVDSNEKNRRKKLLKTIN